MEVALFPTYARRVPTSDDHYLVVSERENTSTLEPWSFKINGWAHHCKEKRNVSTAIAQGLLKTMTCVNKTNDEEDQFFASNYKLIRSKYAKGLKMQTQLCGFGVPAWHFKISLPTLAYHCTFCKKDADPSVPSLPYQPETVLSDSKGDFEVAYNIKDETAETWYQRIPDENTLLGHKYLLIKALNESATSETMAVVELIESKGISCISDIDDTIKIANVVKGKRSVIATALLRLSEAVPGMSDLYRFWWLHGVSFHYVSNFPGLLYPSLSAFLHENGFPVGSCHLKKYKVRDKSYKKVFKAPDLAKLDRVEGILNDFPERKFILVGDTGQRDIELYGRITRKYSNNILCSYIRNVTGSCTINIKINKEQQEATKSKKSPENLKERQHFEERIKTSFGEFQDRCFMFITPEDLIECDGQEQIKKYFTH